MFHVGLARVYGGVTGRLNEQVRRKLRRFPEDFFLRVTDERSQAMRWQLATARHTSTEKQRRSLVSPDLEAWMGGNCCASVIMSP